MGRTVPQPHARGSHFSASPWTPAGYRITPERSKRALTIYKRFRITIRIFSQPRRLGSSWPAIQPQWARHQQRGSGYQGFGPGRFETRDPASIHPYDGPVPLAARSDLVGSVCCQRLEVTWLCVRVTRSSGFGRSRHQLSSRSVPLTHMVERWPPGLVAQAHILSRRMD